MDEAKALRAEIEELKQQRQELRQLNVYRESEVAKLKEEVEEAKKAQTKVDQLAKVVDTMRARELELKEEKGKMEGVMRRMEKEQSKVKGEDEKNKGLLIAGVQRQMELEGKINALEASHKIDLAARATEIARLNAGLQVAEEDAKNYRQKWKDLGGRPMLRITKGPIDMDSSDPDCPPLLAKPRPKRKPTSAAEPSTATKKSKT